MQVKRRQGSSFEGKNIPFNVLPVYFSPGHHTYTAQVRRKVWLTVPCSLQNSIKSDVAYLDNVCIVQIIPSIFCKLIKLAICSQFLVNIFLWSRLVLTAIELESWLCCLSFGERFLRAFLHVFKCLRCFGAPFSLSALCRYLLCMSLL